MSNGGQNPEAETRWRSAAWFFLLPALSFLIVSAAVAAAPSAESLRKNQRERDTLFKNMKAATTEYTFEYVVIWLKPGSLPGINVPIPVSHIRFNSTVFFKFDKSTLEPGAEAVIQEMAKTLLQDKAMRSTLLVGHTDSIGSDEYNAVLSKNRAVAVAKKLSENGVRSEHLGFVPMGEAQPVSSNSTVRGRSLNRRVEFFVSDVPGATREVVKAMPYNPCHRNDHEGIRDGDCSTGPVNIPVYQGPSAEGRPVIQIDIGREKIPLPEAPTVRERLPNEILQRPPLKELLTD